MIIGADGLIHLSYRSLPADNQKAIKHAVCNEAWLRGDRKRER